jgi:hypothetical protein
VGGCSSARCQVRAWAVTLCCRSFLAMRLLHSMRVIDISSSAGSYAERCSPNMNECGSSLRSQGCQLVAAAVPDARCSCAARKRSGERTAVQLLSVLLPQSLHVTGCWTLVAVQNEAAGRR